MSTKTEKLKLFKWDTSNEVDLESDFDIEKTLNENWDKIDDNTAEVSKKNIEQDNSISELQEEIENLRNISNIMPSVNNQGENITLNNTAKNVRFRKFGIGGNVKQETREGYNLLNANLPYTTSSSGNTIKWLGKENIPKMEVNKYYYLHGKFSDGTTFSGAHAAFVITDGMRQILNKTFGSSFQNTVDISNATNCYIYTDSTYANKTVTEVAIYEGKENKAYEQYGASPSPDYPSEIKTVGMGSVGINITNKNLLYYTNKNQTIKGIDYTINQDKSIKVKGTATEYSDFYLRGTETQYEDIGLVGTFNISGCNSGGSNKYMLYVVKKDKFGKLEYYQNVAGDTKLIISEGDTLHIFIRVLTGVTVGDVIYPMLRVSTDTDNSYTEAKKQTVTMPIQQEMLEGDYFDWDNEEEVHGWKKITLNGTENWQLYSAGTNISRRFGLALTENVPHKETEKYGKGYSTHFEITQSINGDLSIFLQVEPNNWYIAVTDVNSKWSSIVEFKSWLKAKYDAGTPVIIYYKTATETRLKFTDEQKAVAKEIQKATSYEDTTHIYSTDEVSPVFDVEAVADIRKLISNISTTAEGER